MHRFPSTFRHIQAPPVAFPPSPAARLALGFGVCLLALFPLYFVVAVIRITEAGIYALNHSDQRRIEVSYPQSVDPAPVNRPILAGSALPP